MVWKSGTDFDNSEIARPAFSWDIYDRAHRGTTLEGPGRLVVSFVVRASYGGHGGY